MKRTTTALLLGLNLALAPLAQAEEEKVLNVYNWSDYIAEDTIANFEKETGIKVRYDVFDSNEVLEAKLLAGNTGYDLVVPSSSFAERQIKAGVFQPLDMTKLPNYKNLDPELMKLLAARDAGNKFLIPWMWGTTGIGYNVDAVKKRFPDAPVGSWDMVLKPENLAKFKDCGVSFLDAPGEVMTTIYNYIGRDTQTQKKEDLEAGVAVMDKLRPSIKYFHSSQYINDLANGEICVSLGWSGDVFIAKSRAEEAKHGVNIEYVVPKEGALIWVDTLALTKDAKHPNNAHLFLDYILRPKVIAAVSDFVHYANGNLAATEFVSDDVKNNPNIYPPPEVKKKLFPNPTNTPAYDRLLTRAWTKIKTGQ
ncbi:MAG: extracellular solute-binding protein [Gammaproteobacteria bacterium]|nr:extracellular solute-binding protein [Gammaproteobacteria bacterium]